VKRLLHRGAVRLARLAEDVTAQVASRLLDKTLGLKKGESVTIETWNNGLKFALEVVKQARKIGAIPLLVLEDEETYLKGLAEAPKDSIGLMGKHEYGLVAGSDAYVFIPGPPLGAFYKGISRDQYASAVKYNPSWYKAAEKAKLRGARLAFGYAGRDYARLLGKSEKEIVGAQLDAAMADFAKISQSGRALAARLQDGKDVVVRGESSRLTFRIKGDVEVEDGMVDKDDVKVGLNVAYIPPGYVLKDAAKGSATGKATVTRSPSTGGMVEDAVLEFEKGKLKRWSSAKSLDALNRAVGKGGLPLQYFSVGLNPRMKYGYGLDRFVKGAVCLYGFGFTAVCRKATVSVGGRKVVDEGKLLL